MIVRDDQRANSRARIAAAYGDRLFDSGLGTETEDMVLFQVDRRQLMFLFCSHGVKPPFQAALDVGPGKF